MADITIRARSKFEILQPHPTLPASNISIFSSGNIFDDDTTDDSFAAELDLAPNALTVLISASITSTSRTLLLLLMQATRLLRATSMA